MLTVAEAKAVNALLRYMFGFDPAPDEPPASDAYHADRASQAAMLLAGRAHQRLGAGLRPVDVALACSRRAVPSLDGAVLLTLVNPEELPCACPDSHRNNGMDVPYCPRHHWPDMAPWIAEAGYVLVQTDRTRDATAGDL